MSGSDRDKSSSGSQTQNCAKCLNHGKAIPVRNHYCPFKYCLCDKCVILSRQARRESSRDPVVQYRDEQIMVEPMFDSSDEVPVAEFAGLQLNSPRRSEERRRDFLEEGEQAEASSVSFRSTNTRNTIMPRDVQQMMNIFPNEDTCVLQRIYEACDSDINFAVQVITTSLRSHNSYVFIPPQPPSSATPSSVDIANPGIWNNPSIDNHSNPYVYLSFSPQPVQPVNPFPTPPDFSNYTSYSWGTSTITRPGFLSANGQERNVTQDIETFPYDMDTIEE